MELLHSLEVDLNQLRSSWFARFDGGGAPVTEVATRWLGLDAMEPSCEMWAEPGSEYGHRWVEEDVRLLDVEDLRIIASCYY